MGLADLHIHTNYSLDGTATVRQVLAEAADRAGLQVIAITDHDRIEGALEAEQLAPRFGLEAIPGTEISTRNGHLLALFVHELVPAGLSLAETIGRVQQLGGLCIAPHALGRGSISLKEGTIRRALLIPKAADILVGIEVYNGGPFSGACNRAARPLAEELGLAQVGSSDSHLLATIGCGATTFFGTSASALRAALESQATYALARPQHSLASRTLRWLCARALRGLDQPVREPTVHPWPQEGRTHA